jgi:Ni/Co efflux regulator RcnB
VGPHAGGPAGEHFTYHGHPFNRFHAAPFVYPHGWEYRRWAVGAALPPLFLAPAYYYSGWAELGLEPPQPGFQWVRYGPDLLLVNVSTGEVVETIYDAFY